MILKEYEKEYNDYYMFITVHHSLTEVSVHHYIDDCFIHRGRYIDQSVKEIYKTICNQIDNNELQGGE